MPLQATSGAASYDAFGGGVVAEPNYIESVFSTYLYTGNNGSQTITNGIDLSTKGGLVWLKGRSNANNHELLDTARGANNYLETNNTGAQSTAPLNWVFGTTGFSMNIDYSGFNASGQTYASWTFREQPKFFDVLTYTGTGSNTTVAHALGSVPACIMVKRTDTTGDWQVYHRSLANTEYLVLNSTAAKATGATRWNSTTPTSTVFSVGTDATVNASGGTYVAYIFAHDAGGFGLTGTDNVISCGSYTGTGAVGNTITLGYEPQWVMIKRASGGTADWRIYDVMRNVGQLEPNTSDAEAGDPLQNALAIQATGFGIVDYTSGSLNANGSTYIYIAIRRGPMKVPTDATKVFKVNTAGAVSPAPPLWNSGFVTDFALHRIVNTLNSTRAVSRLTGEGELFTNLTNAEGTDVDLHWDYMKGFWNGSSVNTSQYAWMFQRAPSFFDEVCYTGTGSATTVTHNLAAVPELMIVKRRSTAGEDWYTYSSATGNTKYLYIDGIASAQVDSRMWNDTTPTSSVFTVGTYGGVNSSGDTFVAYLFASCAGVSKVGSYTGNGSSQTINCGFTGGARFVLIKKSSGTGDWMVSDSARGIVSGNDPYLELNNTNAEVTGEDWLDTDSTGFVVNEVSGSNANTNGATYIFLAIA